MSLEEVEWALIQGHWPKDLSHAGCDAVSLAHDASEGKFAEVLTSPFAKQLFTVDVLEHSLATLFTFETAATPENELARLCVGLACLHAFIQLNWTGPNLDLSPASLVTTSEPLSDEALNQRSIVELAYGGEPAYHLASNPVFLRWALLIFALPYQHTRTAPWWKLRATTVHQYMLDEPGPLPLSFPAELEPLASYLDDQRHRDLLGRLLLEQGLLHHLFTNDRAAVEYFVRAARATGLEYELTGALGKRTKFQQTALSQLVLLAESRPRDDESAGAAAPVPDTLALNDDTLLEHTEFTSSQSGHARLAHLSPGAQPPLAPLDQCILLALCLNVKNTSPAHGLTAEQMAPYISRVAAHPRNWSVHTTALLLRARLDATRTRTVERAALQLQALVDQTPAADAASLRFVHALALPSRWRLARELAQRLLALGVVRSALALFERLEMWEDVARCWLALERPEKGLALVRGLLADEDARTRPDAARAAKLWCLRGDLEPANAHTHYERAWAVSGGTSGRAMRALGGYHFARGEYAEAVVCLQRAVAVHPLLTRTWFVLGCAQLRLECWGGARDAFARCVTLDDEDGESWSNLASVYLRMDGAAPCNKMLAFRALRQGVKACYDNWRMWANYAAVAADVGELGEAVRAVARVVEARAAQDGATCVDVDVLERLVAARAPRVRELFERTLLPRVGSPRVFRAYSRVLAGEGRWADALAAQLDAYRAGPAGAGAGTVADVDAWQAAVGEVDAVVDALRDLGPRVPGSRWAFQAQSIVRTFMGKTRDFADEPEWARLEGVRDGLRSAAGQVALESKA